MKELLSKIHEGTIGLIEPKRIENRVEAQRLIDDRDWEFVEQLYDQQERGLADYRDGLRLRYPEYNFVDMAVPPIGVLDLGTNACALYWAFNDDYSGFNPKIAVTDESGRVTERATFGLNGGIEAGVILKELEVVGYQGGKEFSKTYTQHEVTARVTTSNPGQDFYQSERKELDATLRDNEPFRRSNLKIQGYAGFITPNGEIIDALTGQAYLDNRSLGQEMMIYEV